MNLFLQASLIVLSCIYAANGYDFFVNANNGLIVSNSNSITWINPLTSGGAGNCRRRGVLKLSFGAPKSKDRKNKVMIDMWFDNPTSMSFNIGDSRTNNGYGGDGSTTTRDAEIHNSGPHFFIYGNDYTRPRPGKLIRRENNVIGDRLQIIIANGLVIWNNLGAQFNYELNYNLLFALNGQIDRPKKPNYDIYFGINRSIGTASRTGSGLCAAEITWLN